MNLRALGLAALLLLAVLAPLTIVAPAAAQSTCPVSSNTLKISELRWRDVDANGHLDSVLVRTTVDITKGTVVPNDFKLSDSPTGSERRAIGIVASPGGPADAQSFILYFRENHLFDTGWATSSAAPVLTYSPPDGIVRVRATSSATACPTATSFTNASGTGARMHFDEAPPLFLAAYGVAGATEVKAVFSEGVQSSTGAAIAAGNFCFLDHEGNRHNFHSLTAPTSTMPGIWTLKFHTSSNAGATPETQPYTLRAQDVDLESAIQGGGSVASLEVNAACDDTAGFRDPAANAGKMAWFQTDPVVPVGGPFPVAVHFSAGSRQMVVEMNGPVTNSAGGAITGGFAPFGNPPNWVIASTQHQTTGAGSNLIFITSQADLPATPSELFTQPNAIRGLGSTAVSPALAWVPDDVAFLSGPRIARLETVDLPLNGCLDGVRATFNEPVSGLGTWTLHWPDGSTTTPTPEASGSRAVLLKFPGAAPNPGDANCRDTSATALPGVSYAGGANPVKDVEGNLLAFGPAPHPDIPSPPVPTLFRQPATDGAAPWVVSTATADCQVRQSTGAPLLVNSGCSPNGKIDAVILRFSEPVPDANFRSSDWEVDDCEGGTGTYSLLATGNPWLDAANGRVKILRLAEKGGTNVFDTDCVPDVHYDGSPFLKDGAGNAMANRDIVNAVDGAGPFFVALRGTVGSNSAEAVFSEDVCAWRASASPCTELQPSDFLYRPTSGGSPVALVQAQTSGNTVTLTLPSPLTQSGMSDFCLELVPPTEPGTTGTAATGGVTDVANNLPFPRSPNCKTWSNSDAPIITAIETVDSNQDGFLDALKVILDKTVTLTGTDVNHFRVSDRAGSPSLVPTCITFGKDNGTVTASTPLCTSGVTGTASPAPGSSPAMGSSCAGALEAAEDNSHFYICFPVWWDSTAGRAIPNTGYTPKLTYTGDGVRSTSGVAMGGFSGSDAKTATDAAAPVLVEVLGGAGESTATLVFSEAVASAPSAGGTGSGPVRTLDLAYVNANAGTSYCQSGASGFTAVASPTTTPAGAFRVEATLSGRLSHDDIVGCKPSPLAPGTERDGIQAVATLVEKGGTRAVVARIVPFKDNVAPKLDRAEFIDASGDGIVDAVRVFFNEPVNDCFGAVGPDSDLRPPSPNTPAFPTGPVNCASNNQPDPTRRYGWPTSASDIASMFEVRIGTRTLTVLHIVTGQLGQDGEPCKARYSDTGKPSDVPTSEWQAPLTLHASDSMPAFGSFDGFLDNVIFLCLNTDQPLLGAPGGGTLDSGTGITGTVKYTAPSGTSCTVARAICDIANVGPDATSTSPANRMATTTAQTVLDGARPVVLSAATDDRDHNGKVDSVRITFSERVNAATFRASDWAVEGHSVTGIDAVGNYGQECPPTVVANTSVEWFWLCFAEVAGASTFDTDMGHEAGTGPRTSYVGGGALRDVATTPNSARARAPTPATDGAPPVVVGLQATPGSATATLTFSEPVDGRGGTGTLSITYGDLYYEEHAHAESRATGFGTNQAVHSPGDRAAALTLNQPASEHDIANDKVCFLAGQVREHGGGLPLYDTCFGLNGVAGDRTPPPSVTGLEVDEDAPAVTLAWTTPDDADIARIDIYVCTGCTISLEAIAIPGQVPPPLLGPAVQLGARQTFLYTPTDPNWARLNFGVVTVDGSGNRGLATVSATPVDKIAPNPVSLITVDEGSANGDRVTLRFTASHDDAGVTTSGKVARYNVYRKEGASPFTAAEVNGTTNLVPATNLVPDPTVAANLVNPGAEQSIIVTGLVTGRQYTFAVIPADERGNRPALSSGAQVSATPRVAVGTPQPVTGLAASAGTPATSAVLLTWTAPAGVSRYVVSYSTLDLSDAANQALATQVPADRLQYSPALAPAGQPQRVTVSGLEDGTTYHFLVRAVGTGQATSEGRTASHTTASDPDAVDSATVRATNLAIRVKVTAGDNGTGNTVTWTLPASDGDHAILGVQVWRCAGTETSTCIPVADLPSSSQAFQDASYTDTGGTPDSRYLVTAYYGTSPAKGYAQNQQEASSVPGFGELRPTAAGEGGLLGMWWVWMLLAVLLLALVVGAILLLRKRPQPIPEAAPEADEWESVQEGDGEGVAPAEAEAAEGAPQVATHHITCPKCSTEFTATGVKPMVIQCPQCGVRGTVR